MSDPRPSSGPPLPLLHDTPPGAAAALTQGGLNPNDYALLEVSCAGVGMSQLVDVAYADGKIRPTTVMMLQIPIPAKLVGRSLTLRGEPAPVANGVPLPAVVQLIVRRDLISDSDLLPTAQRRAVVIGGLLQRALLPDGGEDGES